MNNNYKIHQYKTSEILVSSLAKRIVYDLNKAIEKNGRASVAFSGGSTPKKLFEELSNLELDWHKVTVTLVDERWVQKHDSNSNEKLIKKHLIKNQAAKVKFIALKNIVSRAIDGVAITQNRLKKIDRLDVVVLGMGTDAHTASFFADVDDNGELEYALNTKDLCCATTALVEPKERMTLSRSFLLTASSLILHIEGKEKKEVFDMACGNTDIYKMPISSMMQQEEEPVLEVYYA